MPGRDSSLPFKLLCTVLAVLGLVVYVQRPGDFEGYLAVGRVALARGDIYGDVPPGINTWPPFFSLLAVPLALAAAPTPYLARGIWVLLNYVSLFVALSVIARLVDGGGDAEPEGRIRGADPFGREVRMALLLTSPYLLSNFEHLQINLILFAMTLAGLDRARRRQAVSGGVLIGFAAAIKIVPIAFLPYLAYRRQWRPAAFTAASAAGWSLSPILVYGGAQFREQVRSWLAAVASGWGAGPMNQSVHALWDRWIGHRMVPLLAPGTEVIASSGEPWVRVVWALTLLIVAVGVWASFRGDGGRERWAAAAEWSIVFLVAALFGPVSWKAYLVVLLLPSALLFAVWRSAGLDGRVRRIALGTVLVSAALGFLTAKEVWGHALTLRLASASVGTWSGLVMLAGLLSFRRHLAIAGSVGERSDHAQRWRTVR